MRIASLDGVTPAALDALLAERFPGVRVESVRICGEVHGTATKAKLQLQYAPGPHGPEFLWIKGGWEESSEVLRGVGIFAREPRVYAELLPNLGVRTPACLGAWWDESTLDGIVLLEDLGVSGAHFLNPAMPINVDTVDALLAMLASLHGATASTQWQARHPWLAPLFHDSKQDRSYLRSICQTTALEGFLALPRGTSVPEALRSPVVIQRTFARTLNFGLADEPRSMIHGDAHIGNSYLDAQNRPGLLDWQCVWLGGWAYDVAYLIGSALEPEVRRRHERDLIAAYLDRLAAAGGPILSLDDGMARYRSYLAYGFLVWLANSTTFQPELYNGIIAGRFGAALVDHDMVAGAQ